MKTQLQSVQTSSAEACRGGAREFLRYSAYRCLFFPGRPDAGPAQIPYRFGARRYRSVKDFWFLTLF